MRDRVSRQAALLRLVKRRTVVSQQEMVRLLRETGFSATQSTISRDVRELGLVRAEGRYVPAASLGTEPPDDAPTSFRNELIISTEPVGANLIVVRTPPGGANAVAVELDRKGLPEIAGTVAGDDTIFVALRSRAAQGRLLPLLRAGSPRRERSADGASAEAANEDTSKG
jgi:transcriptional regulator of arginine metabolism